MPATESHRGPDEVASLGTEVFDRQIRPALRPEDNGKFIAIDVNSGDYEINADDYTAVSRLEARNPTADVWLMRAGHRTTYKMRRRQ